MYFHELDLETDYDRCGEAVNSDVNKYFMIILNTNIRLL